MRRVAIANFELEMIFSASAKTARLHSVADAIRAGTANLLYASLALLLAR
jgi:hypothetical protein